MKTRRDTLCALAAGLTVTLVPLPGSLRAQETNILKQGRFRGESNHSSSGTVAIVERNGRYHVAIGGDFTFDGAPDPKIALGADGYDATTILGALESNMGAQSYAIPASLDHTAYNEVWIWCEQYNVPLGRADLA